MKSLVLSGQEVIAETPKHHRSVSQSLRLTIQALNAGKEVKGLLKKTLLWDDFLLEKFGLTCIIQELSKRYEKAVPVSLGYCDCREVGLQPDAQLNKPSQALRLDSIAHAFESKNNSNVKVTTGSERIVAERRGFYAGLSPQHSNNVKALGLNCNESRKWLAGTLLCSVFYNKVETMGTTFGAL